MLTAGAVIALPGLVDSDGCLLVAPNLGWTRRVGARPARRAARRAGVPVQAENEANLGALAELWEGAGRELRDFIYVSGELGVGAGIVVGGELFRGAHGFGGELGHVTVDPEGEVCACGNRGCLETRVALGALLRAAGLEPGAGVGRSRRAAAGDERALAALADAGRWLGVGVASAANLLNPRGDRRRRLPRDARAVARARRGGGARRACLVRGVGTPRVVISAPRRRGRGARRGRARAAPRASPTRPSSSARATR